MPDNPLPVQPDQSCGLDEESVEFQLCSSACAHRSVPGRNCRCAVKRPHCRHDTGKKTPGGAGTHVSKTQLRTGHTREHTGTHVLPVTTGTGMLGRVSRHFHFAVTFIFPNVIVHFPGSGMMQAAVPAQPWGVRMALSLASLARSLSSVVAALLARAPE